MAAGVSQPPPHMASAGCSLAEPRSFPWASLLPCVGLPGAPGPLARPCPPIPDSLPSTSCPAPGRAARTKRPPARFPPQRGRAGGLRGPCLALGGLRGPCPALGGLRGPCPVSGGCRAAGWQLQRPRRGTGSGGGKQKWHAEAWGGFEEIFGLNPHFLCAGLSARPRRRRGRGLAVPSGECPVPSPPTHLRPPNPAAGELGGGHPNPCVRLGAPLNGRASPSCRRQLGPGDEPPPGLGWRGGTRGQEGRPHPWELPRAGVVPALLPSLPTPLHGSGGAEGGPSPRTPLSPLRAARGGPARLPLALQPPPRGLGTAGGCCRPTGDSASRRGVPTLGPP